MANILNSLSITCYNSQYYKKYKLYYNIPDEKELVLVDGKWRFIIYNN